MRKPRPVKNNTVKHATITVLQSYPVGKVFSAGDELTRTGLKYEVQQYLWENHKLNRFPHIDTCLRYLRDYNTPVTKIICKNRNKSLYEVIR